MAMKLRNSLLAAGTALSPEPVTLWAQKKYFGLGDITLGKLSEYVRAGIHPGSKEFKIFHTAGLLDTIDADLVSQAKRYQTSTIGRALDPIVNIACQNLNGITDSRFLPRSFYWFHLIPYLNDMAQHDTYTEKNLYTKHLPRVRQPKSALKNINGSYFDGEDRALKSRLVESYINDMRGEFIIKPSRTANGKGIRLITFDDEGICLSQERKSWKDIECQYDRDFVVQERIHQHPTMAKPHPESVNTLRILTLRWDGDIHFMTAFARFGNNGAVNDNAGTGGVCVGIDRQGRLSAFGVTAAAQKIDTHPTSGYSFIQQQTIPGFQAAVDLCIEQHQEVLHHNLVSWDIAIDPAEQPIFIEHNFRGSLWLYQLTTGEPILGELTSDILTAIRA